MSKNNNDLDVFEEAASQSIKETVTRSLTLSETVISNLTKKELRVQADDAYEKLKKDIDGVHAHRFNNILNLLPDREFVRVYLKVLEFVKPKVIRHDGKDGRDGDNIVNIQINYGGKEEET